MTRPRLVLFVAATVATVAPPARADEAVLDDVAPILWLVAPAELGFAAGLAAVASGDTCASWGCGILIALTTGAGIAVGIVTAVVAGVTDASGDVPLAIHLASTGGLELGLTTLGITGTESSRPALVGALLGAAAQGAYAIAARDTLLRDPNATPWAHLLAWGPTVAGLIALAVGASDDERLMALLVGASMLVAAGAGIVGVAAATAD